MPSEWSPEPAPIVGVEAMHATLRTWLAETGLDVVPHPEPAADQPAAAI